MNHHEHEGPCRIGLNFTDAAFDPMDVEHRMVQWVRAAVEWARHLEGFTGLIAPADAVLARHAQQVPDYTRANQLGLDELTMEVTWMECYALHSIAVEAAAYWAACGYGSDGGQPEDQWLETSAWAGLAAIGCVVGANGWGGAWAGWSPKSLAG